MQLPPVKDVGYLKNTTPDPPAPAFKPHPDPPDPPPPPPPPRLTVPSAPCPEGADPPLHLHLQLLHRQVQLNHHLN